MIKKIALTISPPDRSSKKYPLINQHKFTYDDDKHLIEQIMKYNRIKTYIIYPEFDDKGRLHYHGILTLDHNEQVRFHRHAIHKLRKMGFLDISTLESLKANIRWILYMSMEWSITKEILEIENPILPPKIINKNNKKK